MAQAAVLDGLPKVKEAGIPTKRPDDYYAEMVKTDDHMKKVFFPFTLLRRDTVYKITRGRLFRKKSLLVLFYFIKVNWF